MARLLTRLLTLWWIPFAVALAAVLAWALAFVVGSMLTPMLAARVRPVLLMSGGMVFAAIGSYARALIYRYANGRPVPGIDPMLFAGVFQPKKGIRRRFV